MKSYLYGLVIFVTAFLLYANTLNHDFVYDDTILITQNEFVKKGISGISDIYSNDSFQGYFKKNSSELVSGGRYRPFSIMMFAIEWELFGANPMPFHLINVLFYALLCVVFFKFLSLLFAGLLKGKYWPYLTFAAALIFVFHPIHTEVVANIKSRDELLSLLGALGAWIFLLKGNTINNKILAFALFLMAMFSKESALVFVLLMPLSFLLIKKYSIQNSIKTILPVIMAAVLYLCVRFLVIGFDFNSGSNDLFNNPFLKYAGNDLVPFSFGERIATIIYTISVYFKLLLIPHPLTHDYYPRQIGVMHFSDALVIISTLISILTLYCAWIFRKLLPIISLSLLILLLGLLMTSNIFFSVGTHMAERFAFISSMGAAILIAYGIIALAQKLKNNIVPIMLLLGILSMYGFKTVDRNKAWKDNFTLMTTDAMISKNSAKVLYAAAQEISMRAFKIDNLNKKTEQIRISNDYLNDAIRIHPKIKKADILLGNNRFALGQFEAAIPYFEKVLGQKPNEMEVKLNLQRAYRETGKYYGEKIGDFQKADEYLTKAYNMNPKDFEALRLLGMTKIMRSKFSESIKYLQETIAIDPYVPMAYVTLGKVYRELGEMDKAQFNFDKALEIDPNIKTEIDK